MRADGRSLQFAANLRMLRGSRSRPGPAPIGACWRRQRSAQALSSSAEIGLSKKSLAPDLHAELISRRSVVLLTATGKGSCASCRSPGNSVVPFPSGREVSTNNMSKFRVRSRAYASCSVPHTVTFRPASLAAGAKPYSANALSLSTRRARSGCLTMAISTCSGGESESLNDSDAVQRRRGGAASFVDVAFCGCVARSHKTNGLLGAVVRNSGRLCQGRVLDVGHGARFSVVAIPRVCHFCPCGAVCPPSLPRTGWLGPRTGLLRLARGGAVYAVC